MSQRQLQRYRVMTLLEAGKITLKEAAEKIGRSCRQAKRIWKRVKEEGVQRVLQLSQEKYSEFNDTHFTEKPIKGEGSEGYLPGNWGPKRKSF